MQSEEFGLKIGINALFWPQERTGSGQYLRHLWEALEQNSPDKFHLLAPQGLIDEKKAELVEAVPPGLVRRGGKSAVKLWWELQGLPGLAKEAARSGQGFDVVHYPYFAAPLTRLPDPTGLVLTIHDVIPLVLPEYAATLPWKTYFKLMSAAARRADLILADSEHSKKDILRLLKVPPRKVQVVYLGVDRHYQPGPLLGEERRALLQRYGLSGAERLLFYLGGFDKRKNVLTLIEAFAQALPHLKEREQADSDGRWVLALGGKAHTNNPQMYPDLAGPVERLFGKGEDAGRVRFLGPVTEEDKPLLYRTAEMYAFPSIYEGFGLDPLEALASGTAVLCSNASSLPEIVGEGGRQLPPLDIAAWREAIVELATRPEKRADLARAGTEQAAKFTWGKTAERTLQLYNVVQCIRTRGVAR